MAFAPLVHALVPIEGFVNDQANIFTPEEEAAIAAQAQTMFEAGRVQYAVVTVASLEELPIEEYAYRIAEGNLGQTEADNGLLLLVAPAERQYRFEVGRGLEGTLNDAKIGRVGRSYLVPAFQAEAYGEGVLQASIAIDQLVQGVEPAYPDADEVSGITILVVWIVIYGIIFLIVMAARKRRKKKYGDAAEVAAWMLLGSRPPGGGGFGGGGFGGFGGGGFGGGGASGGW
jgi:uncharacterized protein